MQDLYVIYWLILHTEKPDGDIKWRYHEGYWQYSAQIVRNSEPLELKIGSIISRVGSRLVLELSTEDMGRVYIEEPQMSVSFRKRYDSEDDKELAEALEGLYSIIRRQHADKEACDIENKEERKQAIFRKLLDMS